VGDVGRGRGRRRWERGRHRPRFSACLRLRTTVGPWAAWRVELARTLGQQPRR
jgi:hypothetical protein